MHIYNRTWDIDIECPRGCVAVYRERKKNIDTVSGLRIVMYANLKRFIHTLPTEMLFNLEIFSKIH